MKLTMGLGALALLVGVIWLVLLLVWITHREGLSRFLWVSAALAALIAATVATL